MNDSGFCIVACPEIPRIIDRGIVSWMDVGFLDRPEGVIISSQNSHTRVLFLTKCSMYRRNRIYFEAPMIIYT